MSLGKARSEKPILRLIDVLGRKPMNFYANQDREKEVFYDSNLLSNPTQKNMEVLMAEGADLVFHKTIK